MLLPCKVHERKKKKLACPFTLARLCSLSNALPSLERWCRNPGAAQRTNEHGPGNRSRHPCFKVIIHTSYTAGRESPSRFRQATGARTLFHPRKTCPNGPIIHSLPPLHSVPPEILNTVHAGLLRLQSGKRTPLYLCENRSSPKGINTSTAIPQSEDNIQRASE